MLVELDIFSGRPNPSWELDEPAARTLRKLHEQLTRTEESAPEPPGLGYRGFLYALDGAEWRAFKGRVVSADGVFIDEGRMIERLLLERLPEEHEALRSRVVAELQ